ncbi:unnamed protein product [Phytomonas sp. EM1]|nr:unnamed protein product [Phytomonas sp. EM1]|eukprot:CCW63065.1 unnamed protein product [Phytomonas sp. isolate EM1]
MTEIGGVGLLERCVCSALLLSHPPSPSPPTSGGFTNRAHKRQHFRAARLFFGFLLQVGKQGGLSGRLVRDPALENPLVGVPRPDVHDAMPNGYRSGCVTIGMAERQTLLRLLGRAAFPDDYSDVNLHIGKGKRKIKGKQTETEKGVMASSRLRNGLPDSPIVLSSRAFISRPIWWFGNLTNAPYRVLVRSRWRGHVLPRAHAVAGSWLMEASWIACRRRGRPRCETHSGSLPPFSSAAWGLRLNADILCLRRIGLTTCEGFFSHRFGSRVILVWLLFPSPSLNSVEGLLEGKGADEARLNSECPSVYHSWSSLMSGEAFEKPKMWFLVTPSYGAKLVERSEELLRIMGVNQPVLGREQPSSKHSSRIPAPHKGKAKEITSPLTDDCEVSKGSLARAVCARQRALEEMLCDTEKITVVDVLPLSV